MSAEDIRPETTFEDAEAPPAAEPPAPGGEPGSEPDAPAPDGEGSGEQPAEAPGGQAPAEEVDKAAEYLALAQRTQADFENYRKRMTKESALAVDRGVRKLAEQLFPALDHLDAALGAIDDPEVVKGIRLVQDEFTAALNRVGIEPFSPQGEPFDPNEHEAMAQQPSEGAEPGTVLTVYQQGYRLHGAVLRPARVVVAA